MVSAFFAFPFFSPHIHRFRMHFSFLTTPPIIPIISEIELPYSSFVFQCSHKIVLLPLEPPCISFYQSYFNKNRNIQTLKRLGKIGKVPIMQMNLDVTIIFELLVGLVVVPSTICRFLTIDTSINNQKAGSLPAGLSIHPPWPGYLNQPGEGNLSFDLYRSMEPHSAQRPPAASRRLPGRTLQAPNWCRKRYPR